MSTSIRRSTYSTRGSGVSISPYSYAFSGNNLTCIDSKKSIGASVSYPSGVSFDDEYRPYITRYPIYTAHSDSISSIESYLKSYTGRWDSLLSSLPNKIITEWDKNDPRLKYGETWSELGLSSYMTQFKGYGVGSTTIHSNDFSSNESSYNAGGISTNKLGEYYGSLTIRYISAYAENYNGSLVRYYYYEYTPPRTYIFSLDSSFNVIKGIKYKKSGDISSTYDTAYALNRIDENKTAYMYYYTFNRSDTTKRYTDLDLMIRNEKCLYTWGVNTYSVEGVSNGGTIDTYGMGFNSGLVGSLGSDVNHGWIIVGFRF